ALDANGQLTFSVGAYDASSDLVIDPTPPPPTSKIWAVAVDAAGNSVAVGHYGTNVAPSYMNVQVIKYDVNGNVLFNTTCGGNGNDYGYGVTLDAAGNIFVTGQTASTDFPTTTGAYKTTISGASDAFVMELNPTGDITLGSTYLGGTGTDSGNGIAI